MLYLPFGFISLFAAAPATFAQVFVFTAVAVANAPSHRTCLPFFVAPLAAAPGRVSAALAGHTKLRGLLAFG